jgi:hypothetical protein
MPTYRIGNPNNIPAGIPVFTCVDACCGKPQFAGGTFDPDAHPKLNPARLLSGGWLLGDAPAVKAKKKKTAATKGAIRG